MRISQNTTKVINPIIRGMAIAGTLPKTEANAVCSLLRDASTPTTKPTAPTKPQMLTPQQTAERLSVCIRSVLRMRQAGKLKGVKLTGSNKSLRFPEAEIERIINEGA